jgi:hypothetical protein
MKTISCKKCLQRLPTEKFYYSRARKKYMDSCKECNAEKSNKYQKNKRDQKDLNFIFMVRATELRRRSKFKNIHYSENLKEILKQAWKTQEGRCHYSGRKMSLNGYQTNPDAMTVDKLEPSIGYVENNIVLCCSIFNRMKQNLNLQNFLSHCREILKHNKK